MINYKSKILKQVEIKELIAWLRKNPVPETWQGNMWSYAFWYMKRKNYE